MKNQTATGILLLLMMLGSACSSEKLSVKVPPEDTPRKPVTGPIKYVALGDSTGVGVGARNGGYVARLFKRIKSAKPYSTLVNLCVSGAITDDVIREQLERGIAAQPTLVTLGIGINDIGHGFNPERFAKNYEVILSRLRNETSAAIVVTNIPDISTAPRIPQSVREGYHQLIVVFNKRLEQIASRHNAEIFDVYNATHDQLDSRPELFSADGFHPSDEGYELWAELMWPTIARTIGVASQG
ncbi:MAG TPA: SGNH/GDSL hydrolase family protein [Pyrinomonadaceae bacterium]|nr:SGNH/GDSL hydrolase family protein [Pyrinomonadaceae bacterium]